MTSRSSRAEKQAFNTLASRPLLAVSLSLGLFLAAAGSGATAVPITDGKSSDLQSKESSLSSASTPGPAAPAGSSTQSTGAVSPPPFEAPGQGSAPASSTGSTEPPPPTSTQAPDQGSTDSPGGGLQAQPAGKLEESKSERKKDKTQSKHSSRSSSSKKSKNDSTGGEGSHSDSAAADTTSATTGEEGGTETEKPARSGSKRSSKATHSAKSPGKKSPPESEAQSQEKASEPESKGEDKSPGSLPPTPSQTTSTPPEPKTEETSSGPASEKEKSEPSARGEGSPIQSSSQEEMKAEDDDTIAGPKKKGKPKSLVEADTLLLKGKFEDAEDAYRGLIQGDETGDAYAGLAVALAKQKLPKKILEAEKIVKKGKDLFGDNPNVKAAGGYVAYVHSKSVASPAKRDLYLEAAENLSKQAVQNSPDTVIAQQTLGLVRLTLDDAEGAVAPLRKAARMADDPNSKALLAEALLKVDSHDDEAAALCDEALEADPFCHQARLQKAIVLTNKGKHEEAFTELLTVPRDQRESEWYRVQGDVYRVQGDGPSALASWKESSRLDPRNPEPYKRLGEYYAMRGDGEFAIAEMHNALEILPNDLNLRGTLAELALRQDKLEVAEQEYRTILSVKPEDPTALLGLSRVYYRKARREGQYPQGWQDLVDKLQNVIQEQQVQGQVVKGAKNLTEKVQLSEFEKALKENHFREARQYFSQVLSTHKSDPYDLLTLGDQAYNDGDLRAAEEAYGYAKEIPEVTTRAEQGISRIATQRSEAKRRTTLGNATWQTPEVAIDYYKQALIADPQYPEAYFGLYKLYFKTKKDDRQAVDYANTFLETSDDGDPLRKEVEEDLFKLKKRVRKQNSK